MSVYLDNHSATKPCQSALEWMKPYLEQQWGASFSPHRMGGEQIAASEGRIQPLYDLVGADAADRFVFTSSGSEAVWQVLSSVFLEVSRKEGKCHFAVSCLEDAPAMLAFKRLEELGCFVKIIPCNALGQIDVNQLRELINPRTALFSISLAQSLTGVLQPVDEIAELCREKGVLFHVDVTYGIGKGAFEFNADYFTFAGDRMHALKSSGALFIKPKRPYASMMQQAVAVDVPSLMALSAAAQQSMLTMEVMGLEMARLRDQFEQRILKEIPGTALLLTEALRLPNVSVIAFPRVHQEALLYAINRKSVYASIGGGAHQQLSQLLEAAQIDRRTAASAIHFSLSRFTTEEEIQEAVRRIVEAHASWSALSEDFL